MVGKKVRLLVAVSSKQVSRQASAAMHAAKYKGEGVFKKRIFVASQACLRRNHLFQINDLFSLFQHYLLNEPFLLIATRSFGFGIIASLGFLHVFSSLCCCCLCTLYWPTYGWLCLKVVYALGNMMVSFLIGSSRWNTMIILHVIWT